MAYVIYSGSVIVGYANTTPEQPAPWVFIADTDPALLAFLYMPSALLAYLNGKLLLLRQTTRSYDLGSGVSVLCDSTRDTGVDLQALMIWGQTNPSATMQWTDNNLAVATITGAQAMTLALGVLTYGLELFSVFAQAAIGMNAGTILATEQIDALPWPS